MRSSPSGKLKGEWDLDIRGRTKGDMLFCGGETAVQGLNVLQDAFLDAGDRQPTVEHSRRGISFDLWRRDASEHDAARNRWKTDRELHLLDGFHSAADLDVTGHGLCITVCGRLCIRTP